MARGDASLVLTRQPRCDDERIYLRREPVCHGARLCGSNADRASALTTPRVRALPSYFCVGAMLHRRSVHMIRLTTTLLFSSALILGCGKAPPKSTTTVHTETTATDDQGDHKTTDTKETVTEMPDGTKKTTNTIKTDTTTPPPGPPAVTH